MIQPHFYGAIYVLTFLTLFFVLRSYFKKIKKSPDLAYSATIYLILGTLIGARLFYAFYYFPEHFIQHPLEILYLWQGGMSFHGGLLGTVLAGFIFCRKHKVDFLEPADLLVIPIVFFLAIGKLANFLSLELYGKITSVPWCVKFRQLEGCRHPVQIYESLKNFFIFFLLFYLKLTKKLKKGVILLSFIFLYTFLRFFIDFFRVYEKVYLGLGSGQWLNLITFLISGFFLYRILLTSKSS